MRAILIGFLTYFLWSVLGAQGCLAATATGAPSAEVQQAITALAEDDEAVRTQALTALGARQDVQLLPLFLALREGSLAVWTPAEGEAQVVIVGDAVSQGATPLVPLLHPYGKRPLRRADGQAIVVPQTALREIPADRRTRIHIRPFLDDLSNRSALFDADPATRGAAATKMGQQGDPAAIPLLAEALQKEPHRWNRYAMDTALNLLKLGDQDPAVRRAAVVQLGTLRSEAALPLLHQWRDTAPNAKGGEPDGTVRQAAVEAIARIESWERLTSVIEILFHGASLGSILLLIALGLSIIFGLMGVINMAHGELMMLGAYATFVVQEWFSAHVSPQFFPYYFLCALPCAFAVAGGVGFLLERSLIRFLYGRSLETLLATWGVSLVLQQGVRQLFGAANVPVISPAWLSGGIQVAIGVHLPYNRLFIIGLAALCVTGMYLILFRSDLGLKIRAVTQNRQMSACLGIAARRIDAWTFALGAGMAGLAGCALSQIGNVGPDLGQTYIVDSFMVVITGGVGKLLGSILAAVGIGGLNKIFEPSVGAVFSQVLILVLVILLLQARPAGLFATKGRN